MKKNIGKTDRIIRLVLGLAILISPSFVGLNILWGLIGVVLIVTSLISFCPLYPVLGVNTRNIKDKLNIN